MALGLAPSQTAVSKTTVVVGLIGNPAPLSFDDSVMVLPQDSPANGLGPMAFVAANGTTLPQYGDKAVVVFDENNTPLCVWFDGAYSATPLPAAGGDASGTLSDLEVNTVRGGQTPLVASQNLADLGNRVTALANLGIARGNVAITFTATSTESQEVTFAHGLPYQPFVTATASVPSTYVDTITAQICNVTATQITLMLNSDNAVPGGTGFNVNWIAIL
jgi:hypothetical protein